MFAEVIIPLAIPKTYTYAIPAEWMEVALPGVRVEVVFGKQKRYAGIIKSTSEKAYYDFFVLQDIKIDVLFIDGDHSYEATLADCEAYYPKLKKGGLFCGHDYSSLDSVKQAVNDFRNKEGITTPINLSTNSAFFWNK